MSALGPLLHEVSATLLTERVPFALVGGLAVSVRVEPRFTRDIDLVIAVDGDPAAESVVARLVPPFSILTMLEHDALGRLAAVRLARGPAASGAVVDLMFASCGIEADVAEAATPMEVFPDVEVPVARTGHLVAMKLLARSPQRPQDQVDLHALLGVADQGELELAEQALRAIVAVGANRSRDLLMEWERELPQPGSPRQPA